MATLTALEIVRNINHAVFGPLQKSLQSLFTKASTDILSVEDRATVLEGAVVNCTASTLAVTAALHANRTITLNRAAGIAVTLPAATGTGNKYRFYVGTTFTGNCTIDTVGSDIMQGMAFFENDSDASVSAFPTTGSTDTLTMYTAASNTTGGIVGAQVQIEDVAAGVFSVLYFSSAGGSEATPFS